MHFLIFFQSINIVKLYIKITKKGTFDRRVLQRLRGKI